MTIFKECIKKAVAGPNLQIKGRGGGGLKKFFSRPSDLSLGGGGGGQRALPHRTRKVTRKHWRVKRPKLGVARKMSWFPG